MSSSGLIYAFIVGAWAIYLVPMWLRREDELNKARQTQRYTTAIKVFSHKESFERRYGRVEEGAGSADEARLPVAVGQGAAPEAGRETLERVRAKERARSAGTAAAGSRSDGTAGPSVGERERRGPAGAQRAGRPVRNPRDARAALAAQAGPGSGRRSVVHARIEGGAGASAGSAVSAASPASAAAKTAASPMLRARRRRVVGVLFALTSLGAIVSMDLGLRFVWAMLLPAAVLSAYIAWVRKDERARAAERGRLHAVAARAARAEREALREAQRREQEQQAREQEQEQRAAYERDEQSRREAAARRRAAAARARAERRVTATPGGLATDPTPTAAADPRDLPRAANG